MAQYRLFEHLALLFSVGLAPLPAAAAAEAEELLKPKSTTKALVSLSPNGEGVGEGGTTLSFSSSLVKDSWFPSIVSLVEVEEGEEEEEEEEEDDGTAGTRTTTSFSKLTIRIFN